MHSSGCRLNGSLWLREHFEYLGVCEASEKWFYFHVRIFSGVIKKEIRWSSNGMGILEDEMLLFAFEEWDDCLDEEWTLSQQDVPLILLNVSTIAELFI